MAAVGFIDNDNHVGNDGLLAETPFPGRGRNAVFGVGTDDTGVRQEGGTEVGVEEGDDGAAGKVEYFLGGFIEIIMQYGRLLIRYIYKGSDSPFCFNRTGNFFKKFPRIEAN
jgi:hypothetical protein